MAAGAGRDMRWKYDSGGGAAVIAGARSDNLSWNQGMIDTTNKDDNGVRTLLDDVGVWSMSGSCSGVAVGTTLIDLVKDPTGTMLHDMEIEVNALGTAAGSFFITSLELVGEDGENPTTFSCNFESSGSITWT